MAPARRARAGLTVYPPSRTLELLAFDEYCRFDNSAFFMRIKRGSLYTHKESRSIKTAISIKTNEPCAGEETLGSIQSFFLIVFANS